MDMYTTYNEQNRELNYEFPCDDFMCASKLFEEEDKLIFNEQSFVTEQTLVLESAGSTFTCSYDD